MKESGTYKYLHNELSYLNQENNPGHDFENVGIIIVNKKRLKNGKKHNVFMQTQQPRICSCVRSKFCNKKIITRHSSMPELHKCTRPIKTSPPRNRNAMEKDTKLNIYKKSRFQSQFFLNVVSEHRDRFVERTNLFNYPRQTKFKIYRCQVGATDDNCCCSCNSDAMFEVMKGLYDCYKAKNCDNCDCVLCGHLQKGEKKIAGKEKSLSGLSEQERLQKAKEEGLLTPLTGKTPEQKEKILRGLAMKGLALPEGQTTSEKALLEKLRADLGLPKEPQDKAERDKLDDAAKAGKLWPLEGKTLKEKEKILKGLKNMGIPLPEGRTPSEKSLIAKLATKSIRLSKATKKSISISEQMRKAKAEGLLTPLTGKSPEQKEKILKGLAMKGLTLPEGQSPSEKQLIDKVRADLGLPKEPKNKAEREKHDKAAKAGLLKPLEGKTPAQKEKILKGLHNMGIPLPEGRTPSEKSLIAKIAASSRHPSKVSKVSLEPSEQMRRAKVEGLLTPLKGKTPEQKQKILEGLAKKGIPLPEGQTPSEKKLIDKLRADLGLPKEPKNKAEREKHDKAAKAGFLKPLEGKTPAQKEKILKGLHDMGIPLPEGRTPSEKSLIAKIAASGRPPSKVTAKSLSPSEQMFRAKAEGLLTPLKGKTPDQKENILKGLALKGLPLPEGQTTSEKKLIDKVRADLGLPKEPKNKAERDKHDKAAKAGLLKPLEGKTPAQKEKILKGLHDMGIPLPEGRTQSEKSLIAKIAAKSRHPSKVSTVSLEPSEQMRRAKVEGLLTPLKGKTPEQKQKILEGLAMKGIPLPEGQTPSEKKLIDKVRTDLGLPKEPKNKAERDKHDKAAKDGLLKPLEGKTPEQKEKILQGLHDLGIPLPEGRTPSEKSLIAKIAASPRRPSKVSAKSLTPSEQMQRAKAEGLLTPLKGKTPEQKENILKGLAMAGLPLPEGQTSSEKKLIDKVRADLALPKEPKNKAERDKHDKAAKAGLLKPLEGKTPEQKETILKGLHDMGIPLPEGRTASEKSLIAKIAARSRHPSKVSTVSLEPSEQMRRAKVEGLLTPLKGKTPEQKEKILKALANRGLPLPEGQTSSEKKLIDKVRADFGLPKEPKNKAEREKHDKAAKAGLLKPLEGKTPEQKEKILKGLHDMGIPLPEGRTASEKSLIAKIAARSRHPSKVSTVSLEPSEQMRRAKVEGLLTPLKGKTPEQKEKILKALANRGLPLPEGQTSSEKQLIDKVRADFGLPKEPKNKAEREKHDKAAKAGLLKPLEGKTPEQKEKILKGLHDMGIPLPEGRTASEKSLIAKIAARSRHPSKVSTVSLEPSEQMRRAKVEGLLTPLKGKTPEQKEKILKALANRGLPLPEGQTSSEKKLIDKVRADFGLPKEPKNKAEREKHDKAAKAGLLKPLEGKTPEQKEKILKGLHDMGIPLPEGRTASEKSLIAKIAARSRHPSKVSTVSLEPSEQMRRAKVEGLLTPLKGKTPEQKEKILKALANRGLPLPEGQTSSEKKLIDKVRADFGLPKEPKNKAEREKHDKAAKAGLLKPLEGKTPEQKEKILKGLHDMGIPLPEGRTSSEKSLIAKIAARSRHPSKVSTVSLDHSEQIRRAKREGLLTPLKGKTPEQKEKIIKALANRGLPLPEGQTPSEKKLIDKVRTDLGLPKEPKNKAERDRYNKAAEAGLLKPLEGKTPEQKTKILKGLHDIGIPLPEGRTPSEKSLIARIAASSRHPSKVSTVSLDPSEQIRRAKREGLLTPLKGKTPEQKEKILKALANRGLALPEGQTSSEKKLIDKVRADLGLPKEPKNKSERDKYNKAAEAGFLKPLEGKTPAQKEKILKGLHDMGISLPEGRTPSEKSLIAKIAAKSRHPSKVSKLSLEPSEQMRRAKMEGLLTPLKGKTPEQKENILKGLAMKGIPLPEGQTPSERKLVDKVRADLGLPKEPKNKAERERLEKAAKAGLLKPLEGKSPAQKEKILKGLHDLGIALPEGRTSSEKSLIAKIAASSRHPSKVSTVSLELSEQMRRAKAEGLLTPLKGKTPEQKEKILMALAHRGLPLPEGQSPSEKKIIDKVRTDLGLPKEPKSKAERDKIDKAAKAGLLKPLEGKTPEQKEKILKGLHDLGIALPEGRTSSEKSLIAKIAASSRHPSKVSMVSLEPSEQMRRAKAEGLLTPLKGKTPEQKEKILKALANRGLPLPEGQTTSEKKIIDKVRADLGLPKEPKNKAARDKHEQAAKLGLLLPLEGKTPAQKEKILKGLHNMGIPLPEGRTPSEKSLIAKVAASSRPPSTVAAKSLSPSEQMRKAEAEGLLTPLKGKTPEKKENILTGLAMAGLPLPEGQTASEKKLIAKVRADLGLPKEPKNKAERDKYNKAAEAGLLKPLEGRTPAQKEKILKGLHDLGISLPEGRTPSEKSLIAKIAASSRHPSKVSTVSLEPSEQMRRAKVEGLLTPLKGKTPEQKENILKGLAMKGIPLPEGQTTSEKKLIDKVRADLGLPKEPKNKAERDRLDKAAKAGLLKPLEGKTPEQKEKILKGLHDLGIALPEGRTPSEKSLIAKIAASSRRPSKVTAKSLSPSEEMQRAKAEGLLTPLKGKTPEEKENILKGLAMKGLPLPEGQTSSEKKLIDKVRADLGLPKEPKNKAEREKHDKAAKAGLLKPLEGKTPEQKEKILKGLHDLGIPLPEGRTSSEKSLVAKIAASPRRPSKVTAKSLSPSEQMRRAKAEGLLTPLKGKTPEEKENILKGLAMAGLPLPEGQTPSEKKVIDKVRADLGLPKEPKNKTERDKHDKAAKAGLLKPLEGKTPEQKEKILKGLHDLGIPLPEGRTASEKSLIAKIAASSRRPSKVTAKSLSPSEQMRKAKAEGLLTPLTGKTPEQKQKILNGLAMAGLPLPVGQTPSEKKLIDKVRADLGLPKDPKSKTERDKHEQAAKAGLLQPLEGKSPSEKEKILKGLHNMGIPLPDGRSPSEKSLIAKIEASSRHPSMVDLGISMAKKLASGIDEEFQDIIKTTKCDRACGCDKKKIRFKHSYVKIRVTSPDISSFCDCPGECVPGVKSGAFIDNEGIKVTVGTAVGIPSITMSQAYNSFAKFGHENVSVLQSKCSVDDSSFIDSSRTTSTENEIYEGRTSNCDKIIECLKRLQSLDDIYRGVSSETKSVASSFGSMLVIKSEISLCSSCTDKSSDTISMSLMASSITSNCTSYSENRSADYPLSSGFLDMPTSEEFIDQPETSLGSGKLRDIETVIPQREYTISRMSPTRFNFGDNVMRPNKIESETETEEPIILFNHLPDKLDVKKIIFKVMANKRFVGASSIFIVVPASDDDEEQSFSDDSVSMTSIYSSDSGMMQKYSSHVNSNSTLRTSSFTEPNEQVCGKGKKFHLQELSSNGTETTFKNESLNVLRFIETTNDESQLCKPNEIAKMLEKAVHGVGIDTTADRPCCCHSKECSTSFVIQNCCSKDHYAANAMSKHQIPLLLQDTGLSCPRLRDMRTPSLSPPQYASPRVVRSCQEPLSCSRLSDMRTPSPSPPQCYSPNVVRSRLHTSKICGSCRISDMRTPTQEPLDLVCDVPTGPGGGVGSHRTANEPLSCSRIRDMRTPSPSAPAQCDSSSVMSSRLNTSKISSGCGLPDMRTPSPESLVLPCRNAPRPTTSVVSNQLPHRTVSCCRFPALSSLTAISSVLHCQVHGRPTPRHVDQSILFPRISQANVYPNKPHDTSHLPLKPIHSSKPRGHLCEMPETCDHIHVRLINPESHTDRPDDEGTPGLKPDVSKQDMEANKSLRESLPQQDATEARAIANKGSTKKSTKFKTSLPEQMKEPAFVSDPITDENMTSLNLPPSRKDERMNLQPRPRVSWKSKIRSLNSSNMKHNCVCPGIEDSGSPADEISSHQSCFLGKWRSKMPKKASRQKNNCDRIDTENADIITGEISGQLSKIPEDTSSEKNVRDAGIITDEKLSRHLKTPKDPALEDDPESVHQGTTDGTENQQNNSDNKGFCVCQNMDATSKKCCKMTKLMSNVRKSISHKTIKMKGEEAICKCLEESGKCECLAEKVKDENVRCECLEEKRKETRVLCKCFKKKLMSIKKLSKKKKEAEEKSLKPLAEHGVQTIPEESKDDPCELNCGWIDIEKLMKLRSDLTECTSGFKACKKRKQKRIIEEQPREIELDFEDAIKYYVGKNLEQFQDLIEPLESYQEKYKSKKVRARLKKKSRKENNLAKSDIKNENDNLKKSLESIKIPLKEPCQCPYGRTPPFEAITFTPEAHENQYPKGLKVCLGAKGIAPISPGVAGMAGRGDVIERSGRDGFSQTAGQDVVIQTPNPDITDTGGQKFDTETARRDRVVQTTGHNVVVQTSGLFITGKAGQEGNTDSASCVTTMSVCHQVPTVSPPHHVATVSSR